MHKAIPMFKGNSSFTTWMYRIATNCFLDLKKKKSRRLTFSLESSAQVDGGEVVYQFEDLSPSPFDIAAQNEEVEMVREAIQRLPDHQQTILVMHHSEMRTYEEMSAVLGLPIGTVKSRLNRARRSLFTVIDEQGSGKARPTDRQLTIP